MATLNLDYLDKFVGKGIEVLKLKPGETAL